MARVKVALLGGCFLLLASAASAQVQIAIRNGRVTLAATNATVRQILTEWARVGQTNIVNVERIPGGPLTLELTNVPEEQALDILLRSVSGYMAAPRAVANAGLSRFDRIVVMPTAVAPRVATAAAPISSPAVPTVFPQPTVLQPAEDDQDRPVQTVVVPTQAPTFQSFPPPQIVNSPAPGPLPPAPPTAAPVEQAPTASPFPGAAAPGVSRPGLVVQPAPGQTAPVIRVLQPGENP